MTPITLPTPIPDPSGHLIQLIHEKFELNANLEMTQTVRLRFWTNDNGDFGIPLIESINLNPNFTEDQKARLRRQWTDQFRTATTEGNWVDQNGVLVFPDENGNFPEGSMPERLLWIGVPAAMVPGENVSDKVIAMLIESMAKMVQNGRI